MYKNYNIFLILQNLNRNKPDTTRDEFDVLNPDEICRTKLGKLAKLTECTEKAKGANGANCSYDRNNHNSFYEKCN